MLREDNSFYYVGQKPQHRPEKQSVKIKKLGAMKKLKKRHEELFGSSVNSPRSRYKSKLTREASEKRPSVLKRSVKNISKSQLMILVLNYIIFTDKDIVTKEDIARFLKVRECKVEQMFHLLNLEGVLSQRVSNYAHDTNRNPMFPGMASGWSSDLYHIRDKDKAVQLLSVLKQYKIIRNNRAFLKFLY